VVARTSAGQFKGEKKDVRAIGQALGATHLIEGSVRKDGKEVRITAQLIQSDNGLNLWSGSYDRDLTDVFAIQEDIAQAIAGALRVPLGLKPGERLLANSAIAPESYEQYLRARTIWRSRNQEGSGGGTVRRRNGNVGTSCRARSRLCAGLGAAWQDVRRPRQE
jgi:hypothetical protein